MLKLPKIIAFIGTDGSGKTTQAQLLVKALKEEDIYCAYVFQPEAILKVTRWVEDRIIPLLVKKLRFKLKGHPSLDMGDVKSSSKFSFLMSPLQAIAIGWIIFKGLYRTWVKILLNNSSKILVFDNYFYTNIVKVMHERRIINRTQGKLFKLVPEPHILFYLNVEPEQAWKKHKSNEISLQHFKQYKQTYDEWFISVNKRANFYRVDGQKSKEEIHLEVLKFIREHRILS